MDGARVLPGFVNLGGGNRAFDRHRGEVGAALFAKALTGTVLHTNIISVRGCLYTEKSLTLSGLGGILILVVTCREGRRSLLRRKFGAIRPKGGALPW